MTIGILTLGRTRKFIPPPWYKGEGGGVVDRTPPQFLICYVILPLVGSL